jgi:hypothetical protein
VGTVCRAAETVRREPVARSIVTAVSCLVAAGVLLSARGAWAEPDERPRFWDRFTLDWGYEASLVRENYQLFGYWRDDGRQVSALVNVRRITGEHGFMLNPALSLKPWFGLGAEASVHGDFSAPPRHPWLDSMGLRLGRKRSVDLGVVMEFRPLQRTYEPRRGFFLRVGARALLTDPDVKRSPQLAASSEYPGVRPVPMWWGGIGYRFSLGGGVSLAVQAHIGVQPRQEVAGIGVRGGFQ